MVKWEAASISECGELELKLSPAVDTVSERFSFCERRECLDTTFHATFPTNRGMFSATARLLQRSCNFIGWVSYAFFVNWFLRGREASGLEREVFGYSSLAAGFIRNSIEAHDYH